MYEIKKNVDNSYVAELIFKNYPVLYFNGRSEAGCRALGNRSILSNPLMPFARNIINDIKGREWFRPLAATILKEEFHKWFHINNLEDTPFMTHVVHAKKTIFSFNESILHVDNTCRIQTLTEKQNFNYYSLIKSFFNLSNVPMLVNTSFNLAGEPIVETPKDAIKSFCNSNFFYLYFADVKYLLVK